VNFRDLRALATRAVRGRDDEALEVLADWAEENGRGRERVAGTKKTLQTGRTIGVGGLRRRFSRAVARWRELRAQVACGAVRWERLQREWRIALRHSRCNANALAATELALAVCRALDTPTGWGFSPAWALHYRRVMRRWRPCALAAKRTDGRVRVAVCAVPPGVSPTKRLAGLPANATPARFRAWADAIDLPAVVDAVADDVTWDAVAGDRVEGVIAYDPSLPEED